MDPSSLKNESEAPRKRRFVPKAPPRRAPNSDVKPEPAEEDEGEQARDILKRFNEGLNRSRPKVEKKVAATQIAFGYGGASANIKTYGAHKGGISRNSPLTAGGTFPSGLREEKEYKEPWDYYTYYPTTLPLRRPYSGNPESLDEEEFGAGPETMSYDETLEKPAVDLGLMEDDPEAKMLFLQLPATLPLIKRSDGREEVTESSTRAPRSCALNDVPAGLMGKMLVYRSGAVKLRIGDTLFDVSAGTDCGFAQDVVAINTAQKNCCVVGELNKRVIITPDLVSIMRSVEDL